MAMWSILLLALFAGATYSSPSSRIIGGQLTTIEQYPSMVQIDFLSWLGNTWAQNCAGSILNIRYVLTVSHCFAGALYQMERRRVRAGSSYRHSGGIIYQIDQVHNHPSFDSRTMDGDISVIRISTFFNYGPSIQRAVIIGQGFSVPTNLQVTLAGWGDIAHQGVASAQLRETTVYTVNNTVCRERYAAVNREITSNMICAGILGSGGRDACSRDVGGPMYFGDIIIGVISFTHECGSGTYPGVSTNVASYTDWIRETAV